MKSLAAALRVCCVVAIVNALSGDSVILAQERTDTPVKVTRIFTGPDGVTHAEETTVKMTRGGRATDTLTVGRHHVGPVAAHSADLFPRLA